MAPRLGRPMKDTRQTTIHAMFSISNTRANTSTAEGFIDLNEPVTDENDQRVEDMMEAVIGDDLEETDDRLDREIGAGSKKKQKKKKRKFREEWKVKHPWAYGIIDPFGIERVKCAWCIENKMSNAFSLQGSSTVQKQALEIHERSKSHKKVTEIMADKRKKVHVPLPLKFDEMTQIEHKRVVKVMQLMYYVATRDQPLEEYASLCHLLKFSDTPDMPLSNEYSAYTNTKMGKEFLHAMKTVYFQKLISEVCDIPYFSLLIDESTDCTLTSYMIVYVTYIMDRGNGPASTRFLGLIEVSDCDASHLHVALCDFLLDLGLEKEKMIGLATDGAAVMTGIHNGVAARFKEEVPSLISVHCIAHKEALAVKDALKGFRICDLVEKVARKIKKWVGKSHIRHSSVKSLALAYNLKPLELLRIHDVRWLSRGQVISRMVTLMPVLMNIWSKENGELFLAFTSLKVQFFIHLLADVLFHCNILNELFQSRIVDISHIGTDIAITKKQLTSHFLVGEFGSKAKHFSSFQEMARHGYLAYKDVDGMIHHQGLHLGPISSKDDTLHLSTWASCVAEGKSFVRKIIDSLDKRFSDLDLFDASKIFSPRDYVVDDDEEHAATCEKWIEVLIAKFHGKIDANKCRLEYIDFTIRLGGRCPRKSLHEAWMLSGFEMDFSQTYPEMKKLWQMTLVIPASTVECERGFSKMNNIKDEDRSRLNFKSLSMLMFMSLNAPKEMKDVDWLSIYKEWENEKERRIKEL